ncbi:MAG: transcription antitermination factor NusB [Alphaproteobacteria bacterium]|nr:transcription antitermination factor NusB [Alphaproteobacteria bacterium]
MNAAAKSAAGTPRRGGSRPDRPPGGQAERSVARLAAVQALYQIEMTGLTPEAAIVEFERHRLGRAGQGPDVDGDTLAPPDRLLFADVVGGAEARRDEIDGMIGSVLVEGWTVQRLEAILRALLRAGIYELAGRNDIPARVIVSEYVDIAHAFFEGREAGLANGVLNRLARMLRPLEFGDDAAQPSAAPLPSDG